MCAELEPVISIPEMGSPRLLPVILSDKHTPGKRLLAVAAHLPHVYADQKELAYTKLHSLLLTTATKHNWDAALIFGDMNDTSNNVQNNLSEFNPTVHVWPDEHGSTTTGGSCIDNVVTIQKMGSSTVFRKDESLKRSKRVTVDRDVGQTENENGASLNHYIVKVEANLWS
jgi:hypothetical protein